MRRALVCGGGGFVGTHLVSRLKAEGAWVRGVDLKHPEFGPSSADEFVIGDLGDVATCDRVFDRAFDEVYQMAADMGGAGYVFSGAHDAQIMSLSSRINANVALAATRAGIGRLFFPSSACVYPAALQSDPQHPQTAEPLAYPASPANEYGWEKLFAERMYLAHARAGHFAVRVARFHTLYGPLGAWRGGREKAVAALCRKAAATADGGVIGVWGDGRQTRSFLYIDDAIEGARRLMASDFTGPVNIGADDIITIHDLAAAIIAIAGKRLRIDCSDGPEGVRGRNSDNRLLREKLHWSPTRPLPDGLAITYAWVASQVHAAAHLESALERTE